MIRAFMILSILLTATPAFCAEMSYEAAQEQAQASHDRAASDMIYQQEDTKALYYQNLQIIHLLADIREELKALNAKKAS